MLDNHKKGNFPLKRAFLGESQRVIGRLSNQFSSFRIQKHQSFLTSYNERYTIEFTASYARNSQFQRRLKVSFSFIRARVYQSKTSQAVYQKMNSLTDFFPKLLVVTLIAPIFQNVSGWLCLQDLYSKCLKNKNQTRVNFKISSPESNT